MKYEVLEKKYTENYTKCYQEAISNGEEKLCLIGKKEKYRMNNRNSVIRGLSDPEVVFEYCLYPLYVAGDNYINIRVEKILEDMVKSGDIIHIYQVVKYIYIQDKFINRYSRLPFEIDFQTIIPLTKEEIEKLSDEMKTYKEGEFALYPKSIYDMIQGMIKKTKSFQDI